jgi:hypothetical protein
VNGFRSGEFNDLTSNYVVRASNAHSWVEVYFPDYGWVSFDPTPPAALPVQSGWNRMMLYMDAMASFWREWVIDYDSSHQKILGQQAARGSRALVDRMRVWGQAQYAALLKSARQMQRRMAQSPRRWTIGGLLFTMLLLLLANARQIWVWLRTLRLRAHPERAPRLAATIWYGGAGANCRCKHRWNLRRRLTMQGCESAWRGSRGITNRRALAIRQTTRADCRNCMRRLRRLHRNDV